LVAAKALDYHVDQIVYMRDRLLLEEARLRAMKRRGFFARNRELVGLHNGEDLFVLCTGPSLTMTDIVALKDRNTLAVNGFVHAYGESHQPTYYAISDGAFFSSDHEGHTIFEKIFKQMPNTKLLLPHYAYDFMEQKVLSNWSQRRENIYYIPCFGRHDSMAATSPDLLRVVNRSNNVLTYALMLGLELGFDVQYILGADHDLLSKKPIELGGWGHCYNVDILKGLPINKDPYKQRVKYMMSVICGHEKIRLYADQRDKRIINVTRGIGYLDVYGWKDFDTVISSLASR
jgi:hypothetical protein